MHEDLAVARKLLEGDEAAFRAVFESYFPRLYRFAIPRVGGDGEEARDVVQQSFCRAFERLDTYRGEASLYGWILQICRNALIDRARRQSVRPQPLKLRESGEALNAIAEAIRAPENEQPEHRVARLELLQVIQATLDYLPSHYCDVLEWKYIEENSVKEIADMLNIAPKAAESLLTRARKAFREAILVINDSADLLPIDTGLERKGRDYA
jgi:RNA polymerase sigma-70 factor (ECF subfamily)